MPADTAFVQLIRRTIRVRGGRILTMPPAHAAPNPFLFRFDVGGTIYAALIHVRRTTPQHGAGTTHGRPEGEWHAQMIFDGDSRGAGARNQLRTQPDATTVLFGYCTPREGGDTVIAAWDPEHQAGYSYSKSLQVREETLLDALDDGLAQQLRQTGEIIVAFRPEYLPEYLAQKTNWHGTPGLLQEGEEEHGEIAAPPDEGGGRGRHHQSGSRAARDIRFRTYIHDHYSCCATCGLTTQALLDAAHIIPVSEDGSDHFSNGLRLCKNCHALFDSGLLLVTPSYRVELTEEFRRTFPEDVERLETHLNASLALPEIPEEFKPDPEKLGRLAVDE